jgi:hypothetical protein
MVLGVKKNDPFWKTYHMALITRQRGKSRVFLRGKDKVKRSGIALLPLRENSGIWFAIFKRKVRIELTLLDWKSKVLPLNYFRDL